MSRNFANVQEHCEAVRTRLNERLGLNGSTRQCGLAALPLLAYLVQKNIRDAFIVYGKVNVDRGDPVSHYWVEWNGFILDIMADQFNPLLRGQQFPAVLIAPYNLCERYRPIKKEAIKLDESPSLQSLRDWLKDE
jgi:hypothetical protein